MTDNAARTRRFPGRLGVAPKLLGVLAIVIIGAVYVVADQAATELGSSRAKGFASKGEAIALALASTREQNVGNDVSLLQAGLDSNKTIEGVTYIYIESAEHQIVAHTFAPTFPAGLDRLNPIAVGEVLKDGARVKTRDIELASAGGTIRAIDVAAPIGGAALGVVHVGMDASIIDREVAALRRKMLGWGGIVAVIGLLLALLVTAITVVRPIGLLTRVTRDIVDRGDLTQTIAVKSRDEIGELAVTFASMVDKLRMIPTGLRESSELLSTSVTELSLTSEEGNQTVSRQAAALQETQITVQEIKQTSLMAAQKAEAVLKVAERADDIGRSGEHALEETTNGLTEIRAQVESIAQRITELTERTRQIGLITETVKDLADQSNMLALNAAIEAVRSGEHGKGFAVVAREIRSLADQSIQATNRVREILEDISAAIRGAVAITEKGSQKMETSLVQVRASSENLRELSGIVKENSAAVRQIAAAVNQQNAGITQIFSAVTDLNKMMDDTVKRLDATTKSVVLLKDVTLQVTSVVKSFRV
jgi:methyl-accepting chemotaxis protein